MSHEKEAKRRGVSRRGFLKTAGAAALTASVLSSVSCKEDAQSTAARIKGPISGPYNVLFILTDQERRFDRYPRGFRLPGHERLARRGVTFENHQICAAVCTPSRSVIFTGQHIQHTRMFDNTNFPWAHDMSYDIPTIGHMLRDAGYYTTYHGKWHLSGQLHETFPEGKPLQLIGHDVMEKYGFSDFTGIGDEIGMTLGGYENDEVVAGVAQRWLRSKGQELRRESKPWFMAVGLVNPHDVMFYNTDVPGEKTQAGKMMLTSINREPNDKLYQKRWDLPLAASRKQPWDKPGRPKAHLDYQKCRGYLVGRVPNEDVRWKRLQDYYLNCIADCDRSIDRLMTELETLGMLDNTIVILTSDHGELCGAHGMSGKGATAFQEQNRVPMIISHPAVRGGRTCKAVTSHVDLVPTILAMAGATKKQKPETLKNLHGHDLSDLLANPEKARSDAVRTGALYCFNMFSYMDAEWLGKLTAMLVAGKKPTRSTAPRPDLKKRSAIRSVFDGRYKFNRYFSPIQHNRPTTMEEILAVNDLELFDLVKDPHEMNNLAVDAKANGELILAMNEKMNKIIDEEVGEDVGQMLPKVSGVNWAIDRFDP